MSHVGKSVLYRTHPDHHTKTIVGQEPDPENEGKERPVTVDGSVHHPRLQEFAGLVTQSHDDGTHHLVIFPPNRPPVYVDHVKEGTEDGCFSLSA
ncbi:MAG TPA: hypothetical protein VGR70_09880 [Stellaceae bacterium]|nr:hypothetical protein [Stellaceae bacterium]